VNDKQKFLKRQKSELIKQFAAVSALQSPDLTELVRHLARISAAKDYETFLLSSKMSYNGPSAKGKKP
tara:strand:- start:1876 stop:2079 length:204 start_codon:yes stop_codon:yes gene_type:complete